ncbi:hypothetical protein [Bosea caraganae]|nr:hypothetical protein [Bosea caraganae]
MNSIERWFAESMSSLPWDSFRIISPAIFSAVTRPGRIASPRNMATRA